MLFTNYGDYIQEMGDLILRLSPPGTGTRRNVVTHTEVTLSLDCCLILNYTESFSHSGVEKRPVIRGHLTTTCLGGIPTK